MKQMIMTLLAAVMVCTAAVAQDKDSKKPSEDNNRKQEMVKHRTDKMVEDYQLNDKQAKKLLELNTAYADKMRPPHHGHHGQMPAPVCHCRPLGIQMFALSFQIDEELYFCP